MLCTVPEDMDCYIAQPLDYTLSHSAAFQTLIMPNHLLSGFLDITTSTLCRGIMRLLSRGRSPPVCILFPVANRLSVAFRSRRRFLFIRSSLSRWRARNSLWISIQIHKKATHNTPRVCQWFCARSSSLDRSLLAWSIHSFRSR